MEAVRLVPGQVVRYYLEGWRHGYFECVKKNTVRIRPIVSRYAAPARVVRIPLIDVDELRDLALQPVQIEPTPAKKSVKKSSKKKVNKPAKKKTK